MQRMILTSLLLTLGTTAMAGRVYTWMDKQGVTHFSEHPPDDQSSITILSTIPPALRLPMPEKLPPIQPSAPEQGTIERRVKRDVATQEAKRREYCETVRTTLAQLENNPRLRAQINGKIRRLTEEERQARIAEAKKAIEDSCR